VPLFLGIDGGGTKTRCVLGDDTSLLATGSSSSCKVQRVGEACARDALSAAVHEACVQAGVSPRQISRTCAGVTGTGRPEIARIMTNLIGSVVGGEIDIIGDVEIAFEDAFACTPGVLVIAGTGAIAYGRNSKGQTARAGGYGSMVSDQGSGFWVGVEAARAALRAHDRGEQSHLLNKLMPALDAADFDDFILRANATPPPDFATLFPAVLSSAEHGDDIAQWVLTRGGAELAKMADVVITQLFPDNQCTVATHGGVFSNSAIVRASFKKEVQEHRRGINFLDREIDPARGALQRARRDYSGARSRP
jgi:N-acetylglucosamine kinase-like BadF-type ATPase